MVERNETYSSETGTGQEFVVGVECDRTEIYSLVTH